jgi:hypothetical protein
MFRIYRPRWNTQSLLEEKNCLKNCLRSMNIYRLINHMQSCLLIYLSEKNKKTQIKQANAASPKQSWGQGLLRGSNAYLGPTAWWGEWQLHRRRQWNGSDDFVHGLLVAVLSSPFYPPHAPLLFGWIIRSDREKEGGTHQWQKRGRRTDNGD